MDAVPRRGEDGNLGEGRALDDHRGEVGPGRFHPARRPRGQARLRAGEGRAPRLREGGTGPVLRRLAALPVELHRGRPRGGVCRPPGPLGREPRPPGRPGFPDRARPEPVRRHPRRHEGPRPLQPQAARSSDRGAQVAGDLCRPGAALRPAVPRRRRHRRFPISPVRRRPRRGLRPEAPGTADRGREGPDLSRQPRDRAGLEGRAGHRLGHPRGRTDRLRDARRVDPHPERGRDPQDVPQECQHRFRAQGVRECRVGPVEGDRRRAPEGRREGPDRRLVALPPRPRVWTGARGCGPGPDRRPDVLEPAELHQPGPPLDALEPGWRPPGPLLKEAGGGQAVRRRAVVQPHLLVLVVPLRRGRSHPRRPDLQRAGLGRDRAAWGVLPPAPLGLGGGRHGRRRGPLPAHFGPERHPARRGLPAARGVDPAPGRGDPRNVPARRPPRSLGPREGPRLGSVAGTPRRRHPVHPGDRRLEHGRLRQLRDVEHRDLRELRRRAGDFAHGRTHRAIEALAGDRRGACAADGVQVDRRLAPRHGRPRPAAAPSGAGQVQGRLAEAGDRPRLCAGLERQAGPRGEARGLAGGRAPRRGRLGGQPQLGTGRGMNQPAAGRRRPAPRGSRGGLMRTLVTGGAGFIGSTLVDRLLRDGGEVTVLDNFDPFYAADRKRKNLASASQSDRFRLVEGDIVDGDAIARIVAEVRPDAIVHLAARAGVRPSLEDPSLYARVNVVGTTNLLEAARRLPTPPKFIYASSSSVYGDRARVPFSESDALESPVSPYAATKRATELMAATFQHLYGLPCTGLRFFTAFGPRNRPDLAISKFTRMIDRGEPVPVYGDGSTRRDYTFVEDIVDGILRAIENCCGNHVYNLGNSTPVPLLDMIGEIARALGKQPVLDFLPEQPGDVRQTYADISLAVRELGYAPKTPFREGIERYVAWYRSQ